MLILQGDGLEKRGGAEFARARACSRRSAAAANISGSGLLIFRLMSFTAVLCLLGSAAFLIFAIEPLWTRIFTFVAIGIIPAAICYESGWLMYWILQAMSAAYDPTAAQVRRIGRSLMKPARWAGRQITRFLFIVFEAAKMVLHWLEILGDWQLWVARQTYRLVTSVWTQIAARTHTLSKWPLASESKPTSSLAAS